MWFAGQIANACRYGPDYGFDISIDQQLKSFSWSKLIENRDAYISRIHASYEQVLKKNKITIIKGYGRFINAKTVEVNAEHYTADHITIATGGEPLIPDVLGADYGIDSDGF